MLSDMAQPVTLPRQPNHVACVHYRINIRKKKYNVCADKMFGGHVQVVS